MNFLYLICHLLLASAPPAFISEVVDLNYFDMDSLLLGNQNDIPEGYWRIEVTDENIFTPASEMFLHNSTHDTDNSDVLTEMYSGNPPEGDQIYHIIYSNDGSKVIVCNNLSSNLTIIDQASLSVDTTFAINGRPAASACSDDYIVVVCPLSNLVEVYNIDTYKLEASFKTHSRAPWVVQVGDDGRYACIGCSKTHTCEIIDLSIMQHKALVIPDFPVFYTSISGSFDVNRNYFGYDSNRFVILPGGNHVAIANYTKGKILITNLTTGNLDHAIPIKAGLLALSGDGKYLIARAEYSPLTISRIDLSTFTIDHTVSIPAYTCPIQYPIAVNYDGTKVFTGTRENASILINLLTGDHVRFGIQETAMPLWVASNYDHSIAISSQNRFAAIDFATEKMIDRIYNVKLWNEYVCLSPVANHAASIFTSLSEALHFYSFSHNEMNFLGDVLSGSPIEGDGPARVSISPDGSLAIVSNTLSGNVTIIDPTTHKIKAFVDVGSEAHGSVISSDSKWAFVCSSGSYYKREASSVTVINLETYTVAATIKTGEWSANISIAPDDSYAYSVNLRGQNISVIRLDGASSSKVASIPCPNMTGTYYVPSGIFNNIAISPDSKYGLAPVAVENKVRLIDLSTNKVVATVAVGKYPLRVVFNSDGTRAIVSSTVGGTYSLLGIDGETFSVIKTVHVGGNPISVAFDSFSNRFAVASYDDQKVTIVDPSSGSIITSHSYPDKVLEVHYAANGDRLVLTPKQLFRNSEAVDFMYGNPVRFAYSDACNSAIAVTPGPDMVHCVSYNAAGVSTENIMVGSTPSVTVSPNPGTEVLSFNIHLPTTGNMELAIFDLHGRVVENIAEGSMPKGNHSYILAREELPAGVYSVRLVSDEIAVSKMFTICD